MSGSYSDIANLARRAVGLDPRGTGSSWHSNQHSFRGIDEYVHMATGSAQIQEGDLWERMYVRPKPVIIVCGACKSHNVISSPTCVQCGAPMGWGKERTYG